MLKLISILYIALAAVTNCGNLIVLRILVWTAIDTLECMPFSACRDQGSSILDINFIVILRFNFSTLKDDDLTLYGFEFFETYSAFLFFVNNMIMIGKVLCCNGRSWHIRLPLAF